MPANTKATPLGGPGGTSGQQKARALNSLNVAAAYMAAASKKMGDAGRTESAAQRQKQFGSALNDWQNANNAMLGFNYWGGSVVPGNLRTVISKLMDVSHGTMMAGFKLHKSKESSIHTSRNMRDKAWQIHAALMSVYSKARAALGK